MRDWVWFERGTDCKWQRRSAEARRRRCSERRRRVRIGRLFARNGQEKSGASVGPQQPTRFIWPPPSWPRNAARAPMLRRAPKMLARDARNASRAGRSPIETKRLSVTSPAPFSIPPPFLPFQPVAFCHWVAFICFFQISIRLLFWASRVRRL